ncbi:MAG: sugar ABC transporter permease, partial [Treponema sp.]|nr:sugar ABC transporter permease [Treponema sp.]
MKARTVSKIHLAERLTAYTFVLPMLIIFSIVVIYPTISGFFYSLTDWNALSVKINMVGFYNYKRVVTDPVFYIAVKNTLFLTVLIVVFQNIFGLLFAVLLNNPGQRGKNFFRTTFFIPSLLSAIVTCYTWLYITNVYVGTYGLLLNALHVKNLVNYDFFLKPLPALLVIAFTMVWQYSGYNMVIYLAGLQSMPLDIFDAADIDGATPIQKFFRITLPLIVPSIT